MSSVFFTCLKNNPWRGVAAAKAWRVAGDVLLVSTDAPAERLYLSTHVTISKYRHAGWVK